LRLVDAGGCCRRRRIRSGDTPSPSTAASANVAANVAVNVDACPAGVLAAVEGDGVGKGPDLLEEDGHRLAFPENRIELSNAHETVVQPACGRRDLPGQRQLPTRREVLERSVHSGAIPLGERQE
jgi:hypothetical protein